MEITEELIQKALVFVHPERRVVGLGQLVHELNIDWEEALDLRNEMERRGLVRVHDALKRGNIRI